ncbi:MAG: transposase [bacterium]|nr:transposase [bacterium]
MENRIKQQFELFADRASCQKWWLNQYRHLLSTLAYTLLTAIRDVGLRATELAQCQAKTIRLKLLKVGATIIHNTRKVKFLLSSSFPYQDEFILAAERLQT